ncbi:outer membrane protein transport protein [Polaribacter pectinis]|uniref:Outer membrane protein transport protein n=1 Tax=Polaribacter pectinis TaxID=2738844 RepID=A0A7G9L802_9FLAO|nr:outer membrane protein transport protein [Polaribacter pectinis]QNM84751.1 outer membrane protein transport protein [Polaribacter pectinis]
MKKLFIIATLFAVTFTSYSQSLGYQDLGILFSGNDEIGSARFTSMSGAFGALGGDISAININPAGIAVFNNSSFSGTFNSRNSDIISNYYGNSLTTQEQYFNLSHAGAVLVFDSAYNSEWSKFAVGFNYRITKDFTDSFLAQGNSGVATFTEFPLDNNNPTINYNIADEQRFVNNFGGEISELNFAFSSVHQNKLYVGLGLNFYDLNFSQRSNLTEFNNDGNGNDLDANFYQENITTGTGFSANAGFIYKAHPNFRFGLSYQTPTWFSEVYETTNITNNDGFFGDTEIAVSNDNRVYDNTFGGNFPTQELLYRLKTPSKLTGSAAFIFGKNGLISLDYTNKNYKNIKLSGNNFSTENQFFQNELRNTHNINVGTEWRLDRFSIRGGYKFEQSPDKLALDSDNLEGYSLGAGYNFGSFKLDFSYSDNNRTGLYNFYPQFNTVTPTNLTFDNRTFTATVTLNL